MLDRILDLLFPPVCGFCGKLCKNWLCDSCEIKLNANLKIENYDDKYFNQHIYLLEYKGEARRYILNYKFGRKVVYV